MIEYLRRLDYHKKDPPWAPMPPRAMANSEFYFEFYLYRINDRVYAVQNKEFIVDFEQERIWEFIKR